MGRSTAFNNTLLLTAIFGLLASFSNSFTMICVTFFFLGTSVGVSHILLRDFVIIDRLAGIYAY